MASERRRQRIERLLDEAEEAVSQFDWTAVRNCAQAVLAFDPENADALDLLTAAERWQLLGSQTSCGQNVRWPPKTRQLVEGEVHSENNRSGRSQFPSHFPQP